MNDTRSTKNTAPGNTGGPGAGFSTSLSKGLLASVSLADEVAKMEAIAKEHEGCQCGEVRATLLVNYGDDGRAMTGLVKQGMGTLEMMMTVLRHYYDANTPMCDKTKETQ